VAGLPLDRPLLRIANAVDFSAAPPEERHTKRLRQVHEGLPDSGVRDGSLHMVDGAYDYYHYMQARSRVSATLSARS
jgi:Ufm1-specific protease 2